MALSLRIQKRLPRIWDGAAIWKGRRLEVDETCQCAGVGRDARRNGLHRRLRTFERRQPNSTASGLEARAPSPLDYARPRSATSVCKRLRSRATILAGFLRSRLVIAPALEGMRDGSTATGGAARSSDASRTGNFKFGFGSFAASFAGARPRSVTRVCRLLRSRATIRAGVSRPRPVPVTCGLADGV